MACAKNAGAARVFCNVLIISLLQQSPATVRGFLYGPSVVDFTHKVVVLNMTEP